MLWPVCQGLNNCVLFAIFVYLQCHQLAQQCKIHLTLIKLYSFHILNNVNVHVSAVKKNNNNKKKNSRLLWAATLRMSEMEQAC